MSNWKGSMASGHSTLNGQSITCGLPLMLWGLPWWSRPSRKARWIRPCRRPTGCVIRGLRPSQLCPPRRCTTRRIPSHASTNARPENCYKIVSNAARCKVLTSQDFLIKNVYLILRPKYQHLRDFVAFLNSRLSHLLVLHLDCQNHGIFDLFLHVRGLHLDPFPHIAMVWQKEEGLLQPFHNHSKLLFDGKEPCSTSYFFMLTKKSSRPKSLP